MAVHAEHRQWPDVLEETLTNLNFREQQLQCANSQEQDKRLSMESERLRVSDVGLGSPLQ